jgi:Holliday junction resolvase RusA-like endonuclease
MSEYRHVLSFIVPGKPVQWQRARGSNVKFTDHDHKRYMRLVADTAWAAGARSSKALAAGTAIRLTVGIYLPVPASWEPVDQADALAGRRRPTSTPDLDNWIKLPMDALNGLVWIDDAQVVEFGFPTGKWYSAEPRLDLRIEAVL